MTQLGLKHLIGTPLLRGYMHGFFVSHKLYHRVKAITQPFAYDEWRKKKVKEKIAAKAQSRIGYREDALALPEVNTELAKRLLLESSKSRGKTATRGSDDSDSDSDVGDDDGKKSSAKKDKKRKQDAAGVSSKNPLGDDRFRAMFESSDFQVDKDSEEYRIRFPNGDKKARVAATRDGGEDDDDDDDDDDVAYRRPPWDEDDSGDEAIRSAFGIGGASDAAKRLGAGRGVAGDGSDDEFIDTDDEDEVEVEDRRGNSRGRRRGFGGDYSDNEEDDDVDDEMPFFGPISQKEENPSKKPAKAKAKKKKKKKIAMNDDELEGALGDGALHEIGAGEDAITMLMGTSEDRAKQKKRIEERAKPISERIEALSADAPAATSTSRPKSFGSVIGNRGRGAGGGGRGGGGRRGGGGGGRGRGR